MNGTTLVLFLIRSLFSVSIGVCLFWTGLAQFHSAYFIDPLMAPKIFLASLVASISIVVLLFKNEKLKRPEMTYPVRWLLIGTSVGLLGHAIFQPFEKDLLLLLFVISVFSYIFYFFLEYQKAAFLLSLSNGVLLSLFVFNLYFLYKCFQILFLEVSPPVETAGWISGNFASINIMAQYMTLSIILGSYSFLKKMTKLKGSLLFFSGLLLNLTECRSCILSLVVFLFVLIVRYRQLRIFSGSLILMSVLQLLFLNQYVVPKYENIRLAKGSSMQMRLELWEESLQIIKEKPFGIGYGQYDYNTFPYRYKGIAQFTESFNDRSPHNEFLKFAVELGVVPTGLFLCFIFFLVLGFVRKVKKTSFLHRDALILGLLIFFFVESSLQFPYEVSHGVAGFSLLLALLFWRQFEGRSVPVGIVSKSIASIIVGLFLCFHLFFIHNIQKVDFFFGDFTTWTCRNGFSSWKRCLQFSNALSFEYPKQSDQVLRALVYFQPFNAHIINDLVLRVEPDSPLFCKVARIYQEIYNYKTRSTQDYSRKCSLPRLSQKESLFTAFAEVYAEGGFELHPAYRWIYQ